MQTQPLLLITSLMRGMAHRLLTPLSVISNDLSYLKNQLPPGECDRSLARCREIADSLKSVAALGSPAVKYERLPAVDFFRAELAGAGIALDVRVAGPAFVAADRRLLATALKLLAEMLAALSVGAAPRAALAKYEAAGALVLSFEIGSSAEGGRQGGFTTLTELSRAVLESDHYGPVFADAILWAHGGAVRAEAGERVNVEVSLPLCA